MARSSFKNFASLPDKEASANDPEQTKRLTLKGANAKGVETDAFHTQ
jgi:hypothetical protein